MRTNPCICSWPDCKALHTSICEVAPSSHVWCKNNIRINFITCDATQLSLKKYALREAIYKHIPIRELHSKHSEKNLFIAPHHFPICLLQWREKHKVVGFSKLLSPSDLCNMDDVDNGIQLLKERSNSASFLMRKHHLYDLTKFKSMFVQSPCNTRFSVTGFLASYRRCVDSRRVINRVTVPDNGDFTTPGQLRTSIEPVRLDFTSPASNIHLSGLSTPPNPPSAP